MVQPKNKSLYIRIVTDAVVILTAFAAPWWLAVIVAIAGAFYFQRYVELVVIGIIIDSLYNGPAGWFGGFPFAFTLVALVLYLIFGYAKTFLRAS